MRAKSEHLWVKDSNKPQGRGLWKGIQKHKILVEDMSVTQVKKGDAVLFWWDKWLGNHALKLKFPNIYKISIQKNATIIEVTANAAWNLKFRRNQTQAEMDEMLTLFVRNGSPPSLDENAEDEVLCTLVDGFKVKNCYNSLIQQLPTDPVLLPANCIWINFVPPKVQMLMWSAAQNATATTYNLQYRGCTFQNLICSLCNLQQESVHHPLLHCEFTHTIWNYFIWGYNVRWAQASSIIGLLEACKFRRGRHRGRKIWPLIPFAIVWAIWNGRNRRVMAHKRPKTSAEVINEVKLLIFIWVQIRNGLGIIVLET
ncbi:uncharacterized protein LOC113279173 [Papaver somniferum]|uniref:uncharacterized protein LOC113279173 n=1 Tax=Papaver somniferum TaxID=3469 RepID=UPI000E6FD0E4|nr:uncharacterized protein LOC113279173 [Papaver somniferum]